MAVRATESASMKATEPLVSLGVLDALRTAIEPDDDARNAIDR